MTSKIYKSAMGKTVDLGALILENENTRAVGNMNVNARGDVLDSANRVINTKTQQVQRQYKKQSVNTSDMPRTVISRESKKKQVLEIEETVLADSVTVDDTETNLSANNDVEHVEETSTPIPRGGLAAALAKSQAVKQELMKTPRQLAQEKAGVKKI